MNTQKRSFFVTALFALPFFFAACSSASSQPTISPTSVPVSSAIPVACTMEAKLCPDGSSVGRTGPNCEFAPCPDEKNNEKNTPSPKITQATSKDEKLSVEVPDGWQWSAKDHSVRITNDDYKSTIVVEYGTAGQFLTEQEGGATGKPVVVGAAKIAGKNVTKMKLIAENKVTMIAFAEPSSSVGVPIKIGKNILRVDAIVNPELSAAALAKVESVVDQVSASIKLAE